ncbi:Bgt-728 [Blumeria graminis f. sp. tritici]|uniref:Bgt-728 n=2 Tax=Blumeria graminis f. sp. tritici TaxID=62690 RepID=A0A381L8A4_BLUGR|nr:Acetolactate synthase [Blumeria graminis f. sp. tritici 96224]VDB92591.1 Bgt-728 [Blumeria graminis f. sp. tritici]
MLTPKAAKTATRTLGVRWVSANHLRTITCSSGKIHLRNVSSKAKLESMTATTPLYNSFFSYTS